MSGWKNLERKVAKKIGGKRNLRGDDFSKKESDVKHDKFTIECKYRKKLPMIIRKGLEQAASYDSDKPPLLVIKKKYEHGEIACLWLEDLLKLI